MIGTSKYLCKQSALYSDIECLNIHQPLTTRYNDIIRDFESISHLTESRSKRSAWFGGVGTVFKHLFGNMDENDAIRYSNAIHIIENDQSKLSQLVKENILVTTSTISSLKDTLNKINVNEQQLNSAVDTLTHAQHNLTLFSDKLFFKSKFTEILNILESTLLTLSFKLEDVINGIMFSKSNVLYPSVITPKQMFNELIDNYRFLADYHQYPVSLSLENVYTLMNISEIATYYNDSKIIYVVKIPLVESRNYYLYHNIPYPVLIENNSYVTIIPSIKYIAITRERSHYCKLESLSSCKIIYNTNYICEIPDVYSSSVTPICESEIFSKALHTVPSNCKTKFFQGHLDIWQSIYNNRWLYVITNPSKLSIDCQQSKTSDLVISGTGILNLPINCIAYYKDSRLIPKYTKIINLQIIQSNFNIINDTCCNSKVLLKTQPFIPILNLTHINLDSITSHHNVITSNIVKNLDNIIEKPHIVLYSQYYSCTIIIMFIFMLIFFSFLCYKITLKSGFCHRVLGNRKSSLNIEKSEIELSEAAVASSTAITTPMPRIRTLT